MAGYDKIGIWSESGSTGEIIGKDVVKKVSDTRIKNRLFLAASDDWGLGRERIGGKKTLVSKGWWKDGLGTGVFF